MTVDWASFHARREAVVRDEGQWVGLFDEWMRPLEDFPPVLSLSAPETRNAPESFQGSFLVRLPDGGVHPVVDYLFARGMSDMSVDDEGRLELELGPSRFVGVQRAGGLRVFRVSHVVVSGSFESPEQIEVHGADMLAELNRHVAWTAPARELGRFTRFTRDWVGPEDVGVTFTRPRDLQDIKLVTVADGVTLSGPAEEVLRRLVDVSLQTGWLRTGMQEVVDDPPIVVAPVGSGLVSPEVLVRPTDGRLLETVAPVAQSAGVRISAGVWLPGDPPVEGLELAGPKVVVRVEQMSEVR